MRPNQVAGIQPSIILEGQMDLQAAMCCLEYSGKDDTEAYRLIQQLVMQVMNAGAVAISGHNHHDGVNLVLSGDNATDVLVALNCVLTQAPEGVTGNAPEQC